MSIGRSESPECFHHGLSGVQPSQFGQRTKPLYKDFPRCQVGVLFFSLLSRLFGFWLGLVEDVWH